MTSARAIGRALPSHTAALSRLLRPPHCGPTASRWQLLGGCRRDWEFAGMASLAATTGPSSNSSPEPAAHRRLALRSDLGKVLQLARPEAGTISAAMALLLVNTGVNLSIPMVMGRVIDYATTANPAALGVPTEYLPALVTAGLAAAAISSFGRTYLMKAASERIIRDLRQRLFRTIVANEIAFFDSTRTGELVNRLSSDVGIVGHSITNNIGDGLRTTIQSITGVSMMAFISPKLTLVMMAIVPPVALAAVFYGRWVRELSKRSQDALAEATKVAEERLSNIRTVRAFAREGFESNQYSQKLKDVLKLALTEAAASGSFYGGIGLMANLSICAMLYAGGLMVMSQSITVGELSSFMLYTLYVGGSMAGLSGFYSDLMKGLGASKRVFELLEREPTIPLHGGMQPGNLSGHVRFENIKFSYPLRNDMTIMEKFNLDLQPGTVTAIVGESGSGKSTIGSLLLRFYDPFEGRILIDGHDVRTIDPSWLRENIGLVSQEPVLFAGTIFDNIVYGNQTATIEQVKAAAIQAHAATFIEQFPDKYDTYCGERGVSLSGGQKQRVAIARALLKNPKIMILDEATSALDAESEHAVQEALNQLMAGRTVVTIAHRLSTIRKAHKVVYVGQGQVLEEGTYDELIERPGGLFRRLVQKQLSDNVIGL